MTPPRDDAELLAIATKAAAIAAAEVLAEAGVRADAKMATAAKVAADVVREAASGDHDSFIRLQGQVVAMAQANDSNHAALLTAILKVENTVLHQNGRIGKLETWQTRVTAIYGAILAASPFVFYGLTKLFEQ